MSLQKLTPNLAKKFGYEKFKGVLVTDVDENSSADHAGIKRGYLIEEVNRERVNEPSQIVKLIKKKGGKTALLQVREGVDKWYYLALKVNLPSKKTTKKAKSNPNGTPFDDEFLRRFFGQEPPSKQ